MRLRLTLIRNSLTVSATLDDLGLVHSKLKRRYRNLLSGAQNDRFGIAAKSLKMSMSTGRKLIVVDLNKYPYRIQTKRKLTVANKKDMAEKMAGKNQKFEQAPIVWILAPYFFPWGYLKDRVFANKPKNIFELKVSIIEEIRASPRSVCKSAIFEFRYALEKCMGLNDGHLGQVL